MRSRRYVCQVQKGGHWLQPGIVLEMPYRDAVKAMLRYAAGSCAKRARLLCDSQTAAEVMLPVLGKSKNYRWITGKWYYSAASLP